MTRGRLAAFIYGVVCYAIFFATFLYAIGFVTNRFVPKTIDTGGVISAREALIIDVLLLLIFAIQHSVMARRPFKLWLTHWMPTSIERSTYVLCSSLALILLFWLWRPMPTVIWHIDNPLLSTAVMALSLIGWAIVLVSSFLINHFELFGLHQVANNLAGKAMPEPKFRTPLFYKLVRHPIYLGFIVAFWATPTMTVGHLLFAVGTTAYILVGIFFEERDLVSLFGDEYRHYQDRVSMLIPWQK
ncbi:MAG TPA: isoprenylcysteine carboxylmethyltransferase family protein [Hyphomicrobium sp.]|jgi:protein-S-isoprenylcysteine O-methyltransferase Ste14